MDAREADLVDLVVRPWGFSFTIVTSPAWLLNRSRASWIAASESSAATRTSGSALLNPPGEIVERHAFVYCKSLSSRDTAIKYHRVATVSEPLFGRLSRE